MVKIRSPKEVLKEIDRLVDKGRRFLPSTRGGKDPNPQRGPKPRKPQPLPKTYEFTPTVPTTPGPTGEDVRWRPMRATPQPGGIQMDLSIEKRPQEMIRMTMKDDVLDVLNNAQDDIEAEQIAELIYQEAEQTQNQELEDALASIEGRRPRRFQNTRANSRQFSRLNLVPTPKKKRKVSAYSKRFGLELKKLKKLHPRTKIQNLMKKAHRRTRAAMKKK